MAVRKFRPKLVTLGFHRWHTAFSDQNSIQVVNSSILPGKLQLLETEPIIEIGLDEELFCSEVVVLLPSSLSTSLIHEDVVASWWTSRTSAAHIYVVLENLLAHFIEDSKSSPNAIIFETSGEVMAELDGSCYLVVLWRIAPVRA